MARKNGPTPDDFDATSRYGSGRADDFATAQPEFDAGEVLDSARMVDPEPESPFLRAQKRVPARRGPLPRKTANRLKAALLVLAGISFVAGAGLGLRHYALNSWRFRLDSSDHIQVSGNQNVSRQVVMEFFGGDISRNVFAIPLEERRRQLEQVSWIESATLMRHLPNRLAVVVKERTPVAFVQIGSNIALIDANGVLMDMPREAEKYSFPVIVGFDDSEPLSTRAARMKIYNALVRELDSDGAGYSRDLSEIDLSEPEDVKLTVADGNVLVHIGNAKYLERYKVYVSHVQGWKQEFGTLRSVDLRYDGQVIVNPGFEPETGNMAQNAPAQPESQTPPKAGTKPAAAAPVASWTAAGAGRKPGSSARRSKKTRPKRAPRVKHRQADAEE